MSQESVKQSTVESQSCGAILAQARSDQGRRVDEIARELNLSESQIRSIELNRIEDLPEATYVRGYIRAYASLLGLDAAQVLIHLDASTAQPVNNISTRFESSASRQSDKQIYAVIVKAIAVLVVVAIAISWWFDKTSQPVVEAGSTVQTAQQTSVENLQEITQASISTAATDVSVSVVEQNQVEQNQLVPLATHRLLLEFNETSWVDIRDADDKRLAYQTFPGGDSFNVESTTPLRVIIGNANGVKVQYNEQIFDLAPYRRGDAARFQIGQ